MTRLTFQFIPLSPVSLEGYNPEQSSGRIESIDRLADGLTTVQLKGGGKVEYDIDGTLRYSETINTASVDVLDAIFDKAVETLEGLSLTESRRYNVCMILNGESVVSSYIDAADDIGDFGAMEFGNRSPEYTELSDRSIKLSFSRQGTAVTF